MSTQTATSTTETKPAKPAPAKRTNKPKAKAKKKVKAKAAKKAPSKKATGNGELSPSKRILQITVRNPKLTVDAIVARCKAQKIKVSEAQMRRVCGFAHGVMQAMKAK